MSVTIIFSDHTDENAIKVLISSLKIETDDRGIKYTFHNLFISSSASY